MMTERLSINGMRFRLADIMAMGDWNEQFEIIECLGVLHHLQDPEAGLKHLVNLLVPGGIIKLGYYSAAARENITRLRHERPPQGDVADREYIRELRHRLFSDPHYRQYADVLELGDFYTTSGASNVLLHEQESQYTIPRLQQVLDDAGLQFLSFIEEDKPRFAAAGGQGSPSELMNWHPLEEKDPKFFAGMYEFYCQKKP
jgi:SAM-dependent methyltransferase